MFPVRSRTSSWTITANSEEGHFSVSNIKMAPAGEGHRYLVYNIRYPLRPHHEHGRKSGRNGVQRPYSQVWHATASHQRLHWWPHCDCILCTRQQVDSSNTGEAYPNGWHELRARWIQVTRDTIHHREPVYSLGKLLMKASETWQPSRHLSRSYRPGLAEWISQNCQE